MNMKTIVRDIRVDAPVERVFDFLLDPNNLPEIWPNIVEVKGVKKSKDNEGFNFNWVTKCPAYCSKANAKRLNISPMNAWLSKAVRDLIAPSRGDSSPQREKRM